MDEQQIRIKINNITRVQRSVYRILRQKWGLQRREANFVMLGYIMAEDAMYNPILAIANTAEDIFKQAGAYTNPALDKSIHDWQHMITSYVDKRSKSVSVEKQ